MCSVPLGDNVTVLRDLHSGFNGAGSVLLHCLVIYTESTIKEPGRKYCVCVCVCVCV